MDGAGNATSDGVGNTTVAEASPTAAVYNNKAGSSGRSNGGDSAAVLGAAAGVGALVAIGSAGFLVRKYLRRRAALVHFVATHPHPLEPTPAPASATKELEPPPGTALESV